MAANVCGPAFGYLKEAGVENCNAEAFYGLFTAAKVPHFVGRTK